jgi:hypothetical protein
MPVVNPEKLVALQRNPEGIRNVSGGWRGNFGIFADRRRDLHLSPRCKYTRKPFLVSEIQLFNRIMERLPLQTPLLPRTASFLPSSQARSDTSILGQMNKFVGLLWNLLPSPYTSPCCEELRQMPHLNKRNIS